MLDQIEEQYYGEVGTPERDRIERKLEALRIGFKIRSAKERKRKLRKQSLQAALIKNVGLLFFFRLRDQVLCLFYSY